MVTGAVFALSILIFPVSSSRLERQIRVATERAVVASQRSEIHELSSDRGVRRWAVGLTSFLFIASQSICTLLTALSGMRLIIGLGALAAVAAGAQTPPGGLHRDATAFP